MAKVLLAGESWIVSTTEYKGYDSFTSSKLESGCDHLIDELRKRGHEVTHLFAHDVQEKFPWTIEELNQYDVIILSDIGANSFNLSHRVFEEGRATVNRLELLKEWVNNGGSLMMAGGYLSFSGFEGKAHYHDTPIEEVLPVEIFPYDDRREIPQGAQPVVVTASQITDGLGDFPLVLGYQQLKAKDDSKILMSVDDDPLLIIRQVGAGRTLAYASDVAPHWASADFMKWEGYGEFFSRCINWLAQTK